MQQKSLGLIETQGLAAGIEAARDRRVGAGSRARRCGGEVGQCGAGGL